MDIYPIKTEADYHEALKEIEDLFDASPNTPEGDRLDVLTALVEAYEARASYTLPLPDPIEAIVYHMKSRGLSEQDLEPYIGSRKQVLDILHRKIPLSLDMIQRLHRGLGISAEVLIQPYTLLKRAA